MQLTFILRENKTKKSKKILMLTKIVVLFYEKEIYLFVCNKNFYTLILDWNSITF